MKVLKGIEKYRKALKEVIESYSPEPIVKEEGWVSSIKETVVSVKGLSAAKYYELVKFQSGAKGIVIDIHGEEIRVMLLDRDKPVRVAMPVFRTDVIVSVPVSNRILGRMVDPLGNPVDGGLPIKSSVFYPVEREAPSVFEREAVREQLYTGIKLIDAMLPIGKGQRELILGDPSTGKTSIAVDMIINQRGKDVVCVYVAIGQRKQNILDVYQAFKKYGALDYTVIVSAPSDEFEGMKFLAPYSGTAIAEFFLDEGKDVLIVYDDLTKHAFAYQTISLLLERPPGREAFPGDIFYIHSRLLERSCKIKGGGSITAIPIGETHAGRISSYIPTNLISITDGQIYLDANLFNINQLPAIDVGKSVSRIGGRTQIPAFKEVAEHLRLYYTQFLEVEIFTKLGVKVFGETAQVIRRGKRLREILKQPRFTYFQVDELVILFFLLNEGYFDEIPENRVNERFNFIMGQIRSKIPEIPEAILKGKVLTEDIKRKIKEFLEKLS